MKVLRILFVLMMVILAVLAITVFVFMSLVTNQDSTELIPQPSNVEYTRWELPEGAKARLGKGSINDIKFSPDGTRFAVATTIGVWMYDAKTGIEKSLLKGERQDIKSVAFSTDGRLVTGASSNGKISRWNSDTGELRATLTNEAVRLLYSVVFSEDATKLASVNIDDRIDKVHVWALNDETIPPTLTNIDVDFKERGSTVMALSPDNRLLATARPEGDKDPIHVWNADTGERLLTLARDGHRTIQGLVFSPDNKTLASCDYLSILLWDMDTATSQTTFRTTFGLSALAFSPNGERLASGDDDSVYLWNTTLKQQGWQGKINQYTPMLKLKGHKEDVSTLAFAPDGKMLLSGSEDGTIRAWDTTNGQPLYTCPGHGGDVSDVAPSEEGNTLISVHSWEDQLLQWDINTGHPFSSTTFKLKSAKTISPDATTLVIEDRTWKRKLKLWDISKNRVRANLKGHGYPSKWWGLDLAFSPDKKMLAATSLKHQIGVIHLWNIAEPPKSFLKEIFNSKTIHPRWTFKGNPSVVKALTFSPNGIILASCGDGPEINLWNTETGKLLFTFTGHQRGNDPLAFSPDGKMLVSVFYDTIYFWDLTTRQLLRKSETEVGINVLQFSPDGKTLVSGGWRGKIQLLDAHTGQLLSTHIGHGSWLSKINKLIFLEDGKTLASASEDGTILLWDWEKIRQENK
ncbi:MAG: WD40 repeat domain-containing protein [Candidatus Poribacteria bacterium]|nr:WD40 repeat domain-containing protein [Candidatus Poribacteria bacterium]